MASIWVIGELSEGRPTKLTLELATLARRLAAATDTDATVLLVGAGAAAAEEVATLGPNVVRATVARADAAGTALVSAAVLERDAPDAVLIGATPEGKDVAGTLVALTDLPILVAANGVTSSDGTIEVEMGTFGGRTITTSVFTGGRGIVLARAGITEPEIVATSGSVTEVAVELTRTLPEVRLVERVSAETAGPSIDEASIIVGAGRGVDGPAGMALVEELATELGGAVGATRAAVDAGWVDFAQQIGQTGKTVKPDLYLAAGVSGAIQHRVGVHDVGAIVAIDKDRDAPITEFADLVVVGDLFEILPRLSAAIRTAKMDGG